MSPNELSQLAPLAEKLNTKSNQINEALQIVNKKLSAMNVGVEVWIGPWEEDSADFHQIGYAKVGETWELAMRTCDASRGKDDFGYPAWLAVPSTFGPPKALLQASRDIRIESLAVLSKLIEEIKLEIEAKLALIEEGKKVAAEL
jgi:hypothetical protein